MGHKVFVHRFSFAQTLCYDTVFAQTFSFLTGPWAKNDTGSYFKAALLSGPPGVGKFSFLLYAGPIISSKNSHDIVTSVSDDSTNLEPTSVSSLHTSPS
jgi:hypothetical protein